MDKVLEITSNDHIIMIDKLCKRILGHPEILGRIIKGFIKEAKDASLEEIIELIKGKKDQEGNSYFQQLNNVIDIAHHGRVEFDYFCCINLPQAAKKRDGHVNCYKTNEHNISGSTIERLESYDKSGQIMIYLKTFLVNTYFCIHYCLLNLIISYCSSLITKQLHNSLMVIIKYNKNTLYILAFIIIPLYNQFINM